MSEDKISVAAKQKKPLKNLASLFSGLGFTKITYGKNTLTVEKVKGQDLQGKPYLEYRVEFSQAPSISHIASQRSAISSPVCLTSCRRS